MNPRPLFADSFFFFAAANPRDRMHARAVEVMQQRPRLVTTSWVLLEVADGFAASGREVFLKTRRQLMVDPHSEVIPPLIDDFDRGIDLYARRPDKQWSLTDCISFIVMRDRGLTDALTGDHHFEQAGFRALLRP